MARLMIFPTPLDARCQLQHDTGWVIDGKPDSDSHGRPGQSFEVPIDTPNRWGCRLVLTADKKVSIMQRGLLIQGAAEWFLYADDFVMQDVPPPVIIEVPVPTPPNPDPPHTALTPFQIIQGVQAKNKFDLSTKSGCGQLVEASVKELHERHSPNWGHIRKSGAQNQYNGHAVDALQLLQTVFTSNGETEQGIYDIVISSESPDAKVAFNRQGDCRPDLYYYNG